MSRARDRELALVDELRYVAKRRLSQTFKDVATDSAKFPLLASILAVVEPALWAEDPTRALLVVMRRAVAALPEETAGKCRDGRTWRHMGTLLYFGSEVDSSLQKYDDYCSAAQTYSGIPWSVGNFKRFTREVRARLAAILLDIEQQANAAREAIEAVGVITGVPVTSGDEPPFIPRPELTQLLDAALRSGAQRICLAGEAGTGKTRFVRESTAPTNPSWVDASDDELMVRDMVRLLKQYGLDAATYDTARVRSAFEDLLTEAKAPTLVIIDGVGDPAMLNHLVPATTRSRVIVTTRVRPPKDWVVVSVPDMDIDTAAAMAEALVPGFTRTDYASIAITFGCRPLLIEHGCRYVQHSGITDIPAYCEVVGRDMERAIRAMHTVADTTDPRLTAIYQQYTDALEREEPESLKLLELLCFVSHLNVPYEYVMAYLLNRPYITQELLMDAQVAYDAAIGPLLKYSLVSVRPGFGISMQPLTQAVLREVFRDRLPKIRTRAEVLYGVNPLTLFDAGWHILTVTGRVVCHEVLRAYMALPPADRVLPLRANAVDSLSWTLLVEELYKRCIRLIGAIWFVKWGLAKGDSNAADTVTRIAGSLDDLLSGPTEPTGLQAEEVRAVGAAIGKALMDASGDGVEPEWVTDDIACYTFSLRDVLEKAYRRYKDSPLGVLDLSVFFGEKQDILQLIPEGVDTRLIVAAHKTGSKAEEAYRALGPEEREHWVQEQMEHWVIESSEADGQE